MYLPALVKRMRAMRRVNIVWVKSIAKERAPKRAPKAVSRFREYHRRVQSHANLRMIFQIAIHRSTITVRRPTRVAIEAKMY
jgi:hypothetical protein